MNDKIAWALPNGLHDALLSDANDRYPARRATFALRACVGDPQAETEAEREAYRSVTVTISGLVWCVIESPEDGDTATGEELWINASRLTDLKKRPSVPTVPQGALAWWIFVQQWNAFIYVAGEALRSRRSNDLPENEDSSLMPAGWNHVAGWLRRVEALRHADR